MLEAFRRLRKQTNDISSKVDVLMFANAASNGSCNASVAPAKKAAEAQSDREAYRSIADEQLQVFEVRLSVMKREIMTSIEERVAKLSSSVEKSTASATAAAENATQAATEASESAAAAAASLIAAGPSSAQPVQSGEVAASASGVSRSDIETMQAQLLQLLATTTAELRALASRADKYFALADEKMLKSVSESDSMRARIHAIENSMTAFSERTAADAGDLRGEHTAWAERLRMVESSCAILAQRCGGSASGSIPMDEREKLRLRMTSMEDRLAVFAGGSG